MTFYESDRYKKTKDEIIIKKSSFVENHKDIKIYNRKKNQVESKLGKNPSYLKGNEIEDRNEMERT